MRGGGFEPPNGLTDRISFFIRHYSPKNSNLMNKVGGRFKLTAMIQRRLEELLQGSRPLIENSKGMSFIEIAIQEIAQDKIAINYDASDIGKPTEV